jgi:hypothetical protein
VDCGRGEVLLPCRLAGEVVTAQYAFEEPCNDAAAPRGTILRVAGAYVMPDLSGPSAKPTALRELSVIALWTEGGRRHAQSVTILRGG